MTEVYLKSTGQTVTDVMSAFDRAAAELTVVDVYDIAAVLGHEFVRVIDRFGCECLVEVVPRVVRILEFLEVLVSLGSTGQDAEELRRELDRLRQERSDRYEQERKHQKELEQVEDVWRGEVQDQLSQITQLQTENKRLLASLSLKESPATDVELQEHEGMSEKESQVSKKLKDLVDKQRDEIRAKDRELSLKNEDIDALQIQQHRIMRINQDLLHRIGVIEAQCKTLIQQRAELENSAQARQQEYGALHLEVTRLRKELQEKEFEKHISAVDELPFCRSEMSSPSITPKTLSNSAKPKSVWVECRGDPGFVAKCLECDKSLSLLPKSANKDNNGNANLDENMRGSVDTEPGEESDNSEPESDKPRFTLEELRDVLQERNELKAQMFLLQEELAYYKNEEFEDDINPSVCTASASQATSADQPESGIRRIIFTAIMPMVAAGFFTDDPTLLPIRRLSFV
uniref:RILP-like protein 1 n=1 Tax=Nothobranchius furzeri TaxID=105023 RepID=A0A1A8VAT7_NOTFU